MKFSLSKIASSALELIDDLETGEKLPEDLSKEELNVIQKAVLDGHFDLEDLPPELLEYLNFDEMEEEEAEEPLEMPHAPSEKTDQLSFKITPKKYNEGMVIAKICPRCGYHNRPIYKKECERCKKLYDKMEKHIEQRQKTNPNFLPTTGIREMATKFNLALNEFDPETEEIINTPTIEILRKIYDSKGITPLDKVYEVHDSQKKELEDALWYRLNVQKDKEGNIIYDEQGLPKPLEKQKYYGTNDIIEKLHLTPEKFRDIINQYNEGIINNLPENMKNMVKYDENGHVIPSSAAQLKPYGFLAPAVVFGTGAADKQQQESKDPRAKSMDIAAWDWERIRNAFGWDPEKKQFTHGWVKYIKDVFEPQLTRYELSTKRKALQKAISESVRASKLLRNEADKMWAELPMGAKVLNYLDKGNTKEKMEDALGDKLVKFKTEDYPVLKWYSKNKRKFDNISGELAIMENKDKVSENQLNEVKKSISEKQSIPLVDVDEYVDKYFNARRLEQQTPKELYYLQYLRMNPTATQEKLNTQFNKLLEGKKEAIRNKLETAIEFEKNTQKLLAKIDRLDSEIKNISPTELDLDKSVKDVKLFEEPEDQKIKELEEEIKKETPPPIPEEKKSNLISKFLKIRGGKINSLLKLSDKQLSLFDKPEEKKELPPSGIHMWGPKEEVLPIKEKINPSDSIKQKIKEKVENPDDPEWKPKEPSFIPPSGEEKPQEETLKKIVSKRGMIRIDRESKDSYGRPITNPLTGEVQTEQIMFPKRDFWIITFVMRNGEPIKATCDKVSGTYKKTGERILVPKYKDLWKKIKKFTKDEEKRKYFYNKIAQEQENDENPWKYERKSELYISRTLTSCPECGPAKAPFESACPQIQWAVSSLKEEKLPYEVKVYDYNEAILKDEKLSPSEEREITKRHNITDF